MANIIDELAAESRRADVPELRAGDTPAVPGRRTARPPPRSIDERAAESRRDGVPEFRAGDTLKVHVRVIEGTRSRVQVFQGVCIRIHGSGIGRTFTVRQVSFGVAVERPLP